jgi:hypothetical protein
LRLGSDHCALPDENSTVDEFEKGFLHRFVIAGALARYRAIRGRAAEDLVANHVPALPA